MFGPRFRWSTAAGVLCFGLLAFPGRLFAQGTPVGAASLPASLFVPGDYVPLSEFTHSSAELPGRITVTVDPRILAWVEKRKSTLRMAARTASGVQYLPIQRIQPATGLVTSFTPLVGDFVAVADGLHNDLPIVTHWNQGLNGGRGGREVGAADGIQRILVQDPSVGYTLVGEQRLINFNPSFAPSSAPDQTYLWNTTQYALFDDGTDELGADGVAPRDAALPAYERYIAENWSLTAPGNLAAIWYSDRCRTKWGLPIAHRNQPKALQPNLWTKFSVLENAPVVQLLHGHTVETGNLYSSVPGAEDSLASFIVPPYWRRIPGAQYPILFSGYYDLNVNTFLAAGPVVLDRIVAEYADKGRTAVGVLWNGGGARVAHTFHRSALDNAARLFRDARVHLGGDPERILSVGVSRGANTGLLLAGDPHHPTHGTVQWPAGHPLGYRIHTVLADVPHTRLGENIDLFSNPTHPFVHGALAESTGFWRAWEEGWTHPGTGEDALRITKRVLFGIADSQEIDGFLVPDAAPQVAALAQRGTRVVLRAGTHDFSRPFHHVLRYVDRLRSAGVPTSLEVHHRFGHELVRLKGEDLEPHVELLFSGAPPPPDSTTHFRPSAADWSVPEAFAPGHFPPILEAPLSVGFDQSFTLSLTGPLNAQFQVRIARADPETLNVVPGTELVAASGLLAGQGPNPSAGSAVIALTLADLGVLAPSVPQVWRMELTYSLDAGGTWSPLPGLLSTSLFGPDPLLPQMAAFAVLPNPTIGAHVGTRTGGLSSDSQF